MKEIATPRVRLGAIAAAEFTARTGAEAPPDLTARERDLVARVMAAFPTMSVAEAVAALRASGM